LSRLPHEDPSLKVNATQKRLTGQLWLRAGAPVLLLAALTIVGALVIFWDLAKKQDQQFAVDSARLVESALEGRTRALSSTTMDFAFWNDAYRAISLRWNQTWIDENFFSAIADGIVVFREEGVVRNAWFAEINVETTPVAEAAARAAGTPNDLHGLATGVVALEMVRSGFALADGQLVQVSVAPVSWETEAERSRGRSHGSVDFVASVDVVSSDELTAMGQALGLSGLNFVGGIASSRDATIVEAPIRDHAGRLLGRLTWQNELPGTSGFVGQVWPIAFGLLLVGALAVLVARYLVARQLEALLTAEAAFESSRIKSEFIASMSHELRTPLNAIIGYSELLQEELDADTQREERARVDAGRIRAAAGNLLRLVNKVLAHARIDAGHEPIQVCAVDALQVLQEAIEVVGPLVRANGNTLHVSEVAADCRLMADPARLNQCLIHLLENAAKFTKNGEIKISIRRATENGRGVVSVEIRDTGIGIERADLARLFQPFAARSAGVDNSQGGAGLGLSITRKLCRAMGGDVTVMSEPGVGSAFKIELPAAAGASLRLVA